MNDWTKTGLFLLIGVALSAVAVGTQLMSRPRVASQGEGVGTPLFDKLDTADVRSLEVIARDPISQEIRRFTVKEVDGVWCIPSHHHYPAEAAERLAKCATALYGLERVALAGRYTADQKRLGVLAPDSEDANTAEAEEIGKRIILRNAHDEPIADLIVGKQVEVDTGGDRLVFDAAARNRRMHYVRRADESATYVTDLNLDLSTRFSDWIEPDLLKLESAKINKLEIDNYELQVRDELTSRGIVRRIGKIEKDRNVMTRDQAFGPWSLEGLAEETEQVNTARINEIAGLLDNLQIAGVRPKTQIDGQPLLRADLSINTEIEAYRTNPDAFQKAFYDLQTELMTYGFNMARDAEGKSSFYASHGELHVATNEGVVYDLYFGEPVKGDEKEIEIGVPPAPPAETPVPEQGGDPPADKAASDGSPTQTTESETKTAEDVSAAKNRYVMVHVHFDPAALGPEPSKPVEPVEPQKPEGYTPAEPEKKPEEAAEGAGDEPAPPPPVQERPAAFAQYDEAMKQFTLDKQAYELDLEKYASDLESYNQRKEEGERAARRLSNRFAPWFYVITGSNLQSLQTPRAELVSPKEPPGDVPAPDLSVPQPGALPELPDISISPEVDDAALPDAPANDQDPPGDDQGGEPPQAH
jgi:hypothetical protein